MNEDQIKSILHPVRVRIMLAFQQCGRASTKQLGSMLPDIPPATLYRHIAALKEQGILEVAKTKPVNGIEEKIYHMAYNAIEEVENTQAEDFEKLFLFFLLGMWSDLHDYMQRQEKDARKEVGFRYSLLYLDDKEFEAFCEAFSRFMQPYVMMEPSKERKARRFSTISIPVEMDRGERENKK